MQAAFKGPEISIHALLAESDSRLPTNVHICWLFLSTLSLRRATGAKSHDPGKILFLSTLSLRRATSQCRTLARGTYGFLSTLSLRRATHNMQAVFYQINISIHALLAESDTIFAVRPYDAPIFLSTLSLRRATYICSNDPGQC